jgi:MmoB/DmpM family protein/Rieske 2Fe-2S protein
VLCNVEGVVYAYDNSCPHLGSPLSKGRLEEHVLTCAAHEWSFDVRTGSGINPAQACLRGYPVRLEGDRILVDMTAGRSMNAAERLRLGVGPVLHATQFAAVVVAAIEAENDDVVVQDEGAYLRVQAPRVCRLSAAALAAAAGREVHLPGELEVIMSSFTGLVRMSEFGAVWWLASEPVPTLPAANARRA